MKKSTSYCTFYIVRHGQTFGNVERILQGQIHGKLTETGIQQAQAVGKLFKSIPFADVFSSDLLRAKHTAEIIALEQQLAVKTSKLLREKSFGKYDGKKINYYREDLKQTLEVWEAMNEAEKFKHKLAPGIESDEEIMIRFIRFLRETAVAFTGKNVLVVTHGAMMRILLMHLGFGTRAELEVDCIKNLGYIKLESDGVDFIIKETNNIEKKKLGV